MGGRQLTAAPREVALAYLASFGSGDPDVVAAHVADDFVNEHASALGSGCEGRAAYRERLPGFLGMFAGLRYEPESTVVEDDHVAVAYRMTATWSDDAGATRPISIRGMVHLVVRDGLVARRTDYWDGLTFLQQSGQWPG